jgi:hypothetical protein
MPRTQKPKPISDLMAGELFDAGHLPDGLRLKCKYAYAVTKAEMRQKQNRRIPPELQESIDELGQALKDRDISPATALQ